MLKEGRSGFLLRSAILLLLGLLFYAPAIDNFWIKDDLSISTLMEGDEMSWRAYLRELAPFDMEGEHYWRPVPLLPGYAEHALFGLDVRAYHVTNILLQVACAIALMALFGRLARDVDPLASFMAGLLVLLAPTGAESVVWIMQRMVLCVSLFSLLGMIALAKGIERDRRSWRVLSLLCLVLALLSKEVALSLPGLYFLMELLFAPESRGLRERLRSALLWALPAAGILGLYFLARYLFWGRLVNTYAGQEVMDYARSNRVFENLGWTFLNGLLPANPGILGETGARILRLLMAAALAVGLVRLSRLVFKSAVARGLTLFGLAVIALSWLPILPIVWIDARLFNARFFHGPAIGVAIILGCAFFGRSRGDVPERGRWGLWAGRLFVLGYAFSLSTQLVAFDGASEQILGLRAGLLAEEERLRVEQGPPPQLVCLYVPDQYEGVPTLEYSLVQAMRPPLTKPGIEVLPLLARDFNQPGFWLADLERQLEERDWERAGLQFLSFSGGTNELRRVFPPRAAARGATPPCAIAPADGSFRGNAEGEPDFVFSCLDPQARSFQLEFRTEGLPVVFGPRLIVGTNCEDLGAGRFRYRPSSLDPTQPELPDLWARNIEKPFEHPIALTWRIRSFDTEGRLLGSSLEQRLLVFNQLAHSSAAGE